MIHLKRCWKNVQFLFKLQISRFSYYVLSLESSGQNWTIAVISGLELHNPHFYALRDFKRVHVALWLLFKYFLTQSLPLQRRNVINFSIDNIHVKFADGLLLLFRRSETFTLRTHDAMYTGLNILHTIPNPLICFTQFLPDLWNKVAGECLTDYYNLNRFKFTIKRYLSFISS